MPDLLETIAESDTAVLSGWVAVLAETQPQIDTLPQEKRQRELLTLAREFARRAAWAADTADGWLAELVTRLRAGMGGHTFRDLLRSGRELCRTCQSVAEIAADLWRLAAGAGASPEEVRAAEGTLATVGTRLAAVEAQVTAFARRAFRPLPELDVERMERGRQQIARGEWLTPEQARAAFLKPE